MLKRIIDPARSTRILEPDRDGSNDPELCCQVGGQEAVETVVGKKDRLAMAQAGDRDRLQGHRGRCREPLAERLVEQFLGKNVLNEPVLRGEVNDIVRGIEEDVEQRRPGHVRTRE